MNRSWQVLLGITGAAIASAGALGGVRGAIGMTTAYVAGGISCYGLAQACFFAGRLMKGNASPSFGTGFIVLACLVKFPLLVLAWNSMRRLGDPAIHAFEFGIVLVYFSLVGWASTLNRDDS